MNVRDTSPRIGEHVTIRPGAGLLVRMPDGRLLPETGQVVAWSVSWRRSLLAGDVELLQATPAPKPTNKKEANDA